MSLSENDIRDLKKRYDSLYSSSRVVRGIWNELERYVVPYRGRMFSKETSEGAVEWDKYDHYDDTAVISANLLSASIHGAILPNLQWFDLKFKDKELQDTNDYSEWLADSSKRIYDAIDNSNFSLEADELILDLVGFGHGFMVSEAGGTEEEELAFSMVPLKEAYFEEDERGVPIYFFRKLEWPIQKIVAKFGKDNLPDSIQRKAENATDTDERIDIIFAIFPRKDKEDADTTLPLAATERPWGHVYFLHSDNELLGVEGGYYEMPVYSVRWRKVSGSQWGHGPGHIAMGDIKQLNQHRLMRTRAIEKVLDPANLVTERGLLSTLDLGPRGLTVVRKIEDLVPYESKANFFVSAEEVMLLQKSIKQAFLTDQLELKESPAMTATEVQVRYELMHRLLGPTLGRMKVDWLNRVVENVFAIELRAGRLKPMPDGLEDAEVNIEFVGALATSQKSQLSNDMVGWADAMAQLSEAYPDMRYVVNAEALGREMARLKNIPETVINGKDEAKKLKAEDAQIQAEQQMLMQAQAEGQAMEAQGKGQQAMNDAAA